MHTPNFKVKQQFRALKLNLGTILDSYLRTFCKTMTVYTFIVDNQRKLPIARTIAGESMGIASNLGKKVKKIGYKNNFGTENIWVKKNFLQKKVCPQNISAISGYL